MKISARNTLPGIVRRIEEAAVIAEVTLEITPTSGSSRWLPWMRCAARGLKPGDGAYAVIKASSVMIGID